MTTRNSVDLSCWHSFFQKHCSLLLIWVLFPFTIKKQLTYPIRNGKSSTASVVLGIWEPGSQCFCQLFRGAVNGCCQTGCRDAGAVDHLHKKRTWFQVSCVLIHTSNFFHIYIQENTTRKNTAFGAPRCRPTHVLCCEAVSSDLKRNILDGDHSISKVPISDIAVRYKCGLVVHVYVSSGAKYMVPVVWQWNIKHESRALLGIHCGGRNVPQNLRLKQHQICPWQLKE